MISNLVFKIYYFMYLCSTRVSDFTFPTGDFKVLNFGCCFYSKDYFDCM